MSPSNPEKPDRKAIEIYKNAHKWTVAGSVENIVTNKSRSFSNDFNPSHRLSTRLKEEKGPSRVSSPLNDGLPKDGKSFPSLTEIGNPTGSEIK